MIAQARQAAWWGEARPRYVAWPVRGSRGVCLPFTDQCGLLHSEPNVAALLLHGAQNSPVSLGCDILKSADG